MQPRKKQTADQLRSEVGWREKVGDALIRARLLHTERQRRLGARVGTRPFQGSLLQAANSGVPSATIGAMEAGRKQRLELPTVLMVCLHYDVDPRDVLAERRRELRRWPRDAPSAEHLDVQIRRRLKEARIAAGIGTPALAMAAGLYQKAVVRLEDGIHHLDLIRARACARALDLTLTDLIDWSTPHVRDADRATDDGDHPSAVHPPGSDPAAAPVAPVGEAQA